MELAFFLAKTDLELSKEEALSVVSHDSSWLHGNLLVVEPKGEEDLEALQKRLAYTFSIHEVLFCCPEKDIVNAMGDFSWQTIYRDNFSLRIHYLTIAQQYLPNSVQEGQWELAEIKTAHDAQNKKAVDLKNTDKKANDDEPKENKNIDKNNENEKLNELTNEKFPQLSERMLASLIWRAVLDPKVKLRNAMTSIHLFIYNAYAVCTRQITFDAKEFEGRRPHLRNFFYSGGMHPRLARAMVNLSGAKRGEMVLDPCCGSGGFLIEAGLIGLMPEGYDINRKMVWGCMRNMAQQGISQYTLTCKDALSLTGSWDYVVTDLPYGLNSVAMSREKRVSMKRSIVEKKDLEAFYSAFFGKLKQILGKRAVVALPHFIDYRRIIGETGLLIEREFAQYVHTNLTRRIVVLTP